MRCEDYLSGRMLMESLGSTNEIAQNKLILLYVFKKIEIPLSSLQVYKIILENNFMNYFVLQHSLDELAVQGMLAASRDGGRHVYTLTPDGDKMMGLFLNKLPAGIKKRIDDSAKSIRKQIRNETLITADYTPESETEFVVHLGVREDSFPLIDIKMTVGTKKDAMEICRKWKENSTSMYSEIVKNLTREAKQE